MDKLVLAAGAVMLLSMRTVEGNKVQLSLQEGIENPKSGVNILALLNEGDKRFGPSISQRQAWIIAEPNQLKNLGITDEQIAALANGVVELNITNPTLAGHKLVIQLKDSFTPPSEFAEENIQKTAKQYKTKNGISMYFVKEGKLIFSESTVVAEKNRKHSIIESDAQVTWEEVETLTTTAVKATEALNA